MLVEIIATEIKEDEIILEALNLEKAMKEDLFTDFTKKMKVKFSFHYSAEKYNEFKYLYTVMRSLKKCKDCKSIGHMVEALKGQILNLPESFKI